MSEEIETVGDALPKELERCREMRKVLQGIGRAGVYASQAIALDIKKGEEALAQGDVSLMIRALRALKGWKE